MDFYEREAVINTPYSDKDFPVCCALCDLPINQKCCDTNNGLCWECADQESHLKEYHGTK